MKTLSASQIGFPCDRNLWYRANGYREEVDNKTKRVFAVGQVLESLVVHFMREDGFAVVYNNKSHDDSPDFSIHLKNGILTGRYDILFQRPGENEVVLGDIKTMNRQAYILWKRWGTVKKYPQYVKQLTVYYKGLSLYSDVKLNGMLAVIGFCKDNSAYSIDYFPYSEDLWEEIKDRCKRIFAMKEPPKPEKIPAWACSYCGYRSICDARPEKVAEENGIEVVDDEEIELAAYMMEEARKLKNEARDLEKEARTILERLRNREQIMAGNYLIRIIPVKSVRLDTKALKVQKPEVWTEFARETISYRFDIKQI